MYVHVGQQYSEDLCMYARTSSLQSSMHIHNTYCKHSFALQSYCAYIEWCAYVAFGSTYSSVICSSVHVHVHLYITDKSVYNDLTTDVKKE